MMILRDLPRMRHAARLLLVLIVVSLCAPSRGELVDAVVATVDKDVILYSDLMVEIGAELMELERTSSSAAEYQRRADELIRGAVDASIETLLLVREARKFPELAVTDADLEDYERNARDLYDTPEEFVQAVGGSVSAWREQAKENLMARRMALVRRRAFEEEISVSDEEIREYYEENIEQFSSPERIYVRQVFLRGPRGSDERDAARAKLEGIRESILGGEPFEDLAAEHSQAPGADQGGVIGWQKRGDLVESLEEAAFALDAGEVSGIVETPFGVHLLKVDEREEAGMAPLDEVRLDIEPVVRESAAEERFEKWLIELRKRSRVRIFL